MSDATRRTIRTAFQALVALAAAAPVLVHEAGLDPHRWAWLGVVLAVALAITRLMASAVVDQFLAQFLPWLSTGQPDGRHELGAGPDVTS